MPTIWVSWQMADSEETRAEVDQATLLVEDFLSGRKRLRSDVINYLRNKGLENSDALVLVLIVRGVVVIALDDPDQDHPDDDSDVITAADFPDLSSEGDYLTLPGNI